MGGSVEMSQLAGTPVLILKEGATRERGKGAQHANITAARTVAAGGRSLATAAVSITATGAAEGHGGAADV